MCLTQVWDADLKEVLPEGTTALMIPNAEIKELFETTVVKRFKETALEWNRKNLFGCDDRMYAKDFEDDYDELFCYGISFFKKRCMVKKKCQLSLNIKCNKRDSSEMIRNE